MGSVHFSSVESDSLRPHGPQHSRPPCPSPSPGVCSNSCPLSPWCHPTISSSVIPFSSSLQSLPTSMSFPVSQFSKSGSQSFGVSASASVLPMNIQDWFPLGKWDKFWKRRSKTISTCIWQNLYIVNPDQFIKKIKLINKFSKMAGYNINMQKSVIFLHTNYEQSRSDIKRAISFTIALKRINIRNKFYKRNVKRLLKGLGVWQLTTQKPINRLSWWKGKFALFQMPATGGGAQTSIQRPTPPTHWQPLGRELF